MSHFWQKNEVLRWLCQVLLLHRFQFYSYCYSLMVIRRSTNIFPSEFWKKKRHPILSYWIKVRYFLKRKCSLFVLFPPSPRKKKSKEKSPHGLQTLFFLSLLYYAPWWCECANFGARIIGRKLNLLGSIWIKHQTQ